MYRKDDPDFYEVLERAFHRLDPAICVDGALANQPCRAQKLACVRFNVIAR